MVEFFGIFVSIFIGGSVLSVAPIIGRLLRRPAMEEVTPEWLENFSVDRYQAMGRLLSDEDFRFIASQPGYDPSIYRKLRRDRLAIFDQYLSRLILDFKKLHTTARILVAHGRTDQSQLVMKLARLRWTFAVAVLQVQFRLQLCKLGMGNVPVQNLLSKLRQVHESLSAASLVAVGSVA